MNERADNHKALQQLSRMERFALMYGHPLKSMNEEHPKENMYRETEELVEANMESTEEEQFEAWITPLNLEINLCARNLMKFAWKSRAEREKSLGEPVAWKTGTFFTEYKETAALWEAKGWPVTALYK